MNDLISITAAPVVGADIQRKDITMPHGATIAEMIAIAVPGLSAESQSLLRVSLINDRGMMLISQDHWSVTRPRPGTRVVIRVVPGKDAIRSVLMVVVAVAAMVVAPYLAGALGFATVGLATSLITMGLTAVGALAINALIPPPSASNNHGDTKNVYQLSGWKNRIPTESDPVPFIAGTLRYAPPFAATSYTEIVGDDQYVRALFTFGYGPVLLDDFRIGNTSLSEYDEVEIELREGRADDVPVTLYSHQVNEENVGIELVRPKPRDDAGEVIEGDAFETPVVRFTAVNTASVSVVLSMPNGLFTVNDGGSVRSQSVSIRIRYRLLGSVDWLEATTLTITAQKREAFFRQYTWELPVRGRYEIELTRMTDENVSTQVSDRTMFAGLQSIRPEYPIAFSKPISLVALRIKATYQLSGALDNFNALAKREMPVLIEGDWGAATSSNPASAYLLALQGKHNPFPATNDEIDWEALSDWFQWCAEKRLKYDYVHDEAVGLGDMLLAICAAGRASPRHDGAKWSVVIDRPDDLVIDHLSPRNSSDFQWSRTYFDPPDGFRVKFQDATNDYELGERVVPWPGHDGPIDLTEELELLGKTDPDEIWIEARRRMYELLHRADSYNAIQSGAARVATRGDLVMGSYDVLTRTQISARVKSVMDSLVELDEKVTMEAGKSYGIRFRTFADDEDSIGMSLVKEVQAQVGDWSSLVILNASAMPAFGDLIHFGELDNVSMPLKVKAIEPGEDFSAVVHMIDAAPIIDQLTDAETPPVWDGRVGDEVDGNIIAPAAPIITSVLHGFDGTGDVNGLSIFIVPGTGSAAILSSYRIEHKLAADMDWSSLTIPVANGGTDISGYSAGISVDVRVVAIASDGTEGPYTAMVTVTIGSSDPVLPLALDDRSITVTGSLGAVQIALSTTSDAATTQIQMYRVPIGDTLNRELHKDGAPVLVSPSSSFNMTIGDGTRSNLIGNSSFGGNDTWVLDSGWAINSGKAEHAPGTSGQISQSVSVISGKYYRTAFVVTSRSGGSLQPYLTGGSDRSGMARGANGSFVDRIQAVTGNSAFALEADAGFDGSIDDIVLFEETGACIDQGSYDYYIEPQNEAGAPGPLAGPFAVTVI